MESIVVASEKNNEKNVINLLKKPRGKGNLRFYLAKEVCSIGWKVGLPQLLLKSHCSYNGSACLINHLNTRIGVKQFSRVVGRYGVGNWSLK